MQPTYYVRHPDDTYTVADPQPQHPPQDAPAPTVIARHEDGTAYVPGRQPGDPLFDGAEEWAAASAEATAGPNDAALVARLRERSDQLLGIGTITATYDGEHMAKSASRIESLARERDEADKANAFLLRDTMYAKAERDKLRELLRRAYDDNVAWRDAARAELKGEA